MRFHESRMYLQYYRLKKEPFHITPDPEFLYLSSGHKEALASIIYGIEQRKGFIAITGEVGVGKTTVLRSYLEQVKQKNLKTIYILNAKLTFRELLRMIYYELDAPCEADEVFEMVNGLHHFLIEGYRQNHNFVLLIDEAQNLPVETLENLRMLSNLETSKDKLIQIVLVGQPELARLLNLPVLRQLKQRIAIRSDIPPLSPKESMEYIKHRIRKGGGDIDRIFAKRAVAKIIKESKGIPRLLNIICDNALITGFGYQKKLVGPRIVKEVVSDLRVRHIPRHFLRWGAALSLVLLVIPFYFLISYVKTLSDKKRVEVAPQSRTSTVLNGKGANDSLPQVSPGNETLDSQMTIATSPGDVSTKGDLAGSSTQGRHEEKSGRETNQPPKTVSVVTNNGGSNPLVAPPEITSPAAINTRSPETSGGAPIPSADPMKSSTTNPAKRGVRKTVRKGETLSQLAREVYGYSAPQIIAILLQHNRHIKDPDKILVGDEVSFPPVDGTYHPE